MNASQEALNLLSSKTEEIARKYIPQAKIDKVTLQLIQSEAVINNVETLEGASYDHNTRTVNQRLKPHLDGFYLSNPDNENFVWLFSFEEIIKAGIHIETVLPQLIDVLVSRAVHEIGHNLTFDLWQFSLEGIKGIPMVALTEKQKEIFETLQSELTTAFFLYD